LEISNKNATCSHKNFTNKETKLSSFSTFFFKKFIFPKENSEYTKSSELIILLLDPFKISFIINFTLFIQKTSLTLIFQFLRKNSILIGKISLDDSL
jgi:hypothetical protein